MASTFNSSLILGPNAHLYIEAPGKLRAQNNGVLVVTTLFLATTWVTTVFRIYARGFVIKALGLDDLFAVLSLLIFTSYGVTIFMLVQGIDSINDELAAGQTPVSDYLPSIVAPGYSLYGATMVAFKFALGLFFLRIFQSKKNYKITIWLSMIVPSIFGVLNIIWTCLYACQVKAFFFIGLTECQGVGPNNAWLVIASIWSALTAITDLLYGVLSVLAIRQLRMRFQTKVTASILCAMGSIGGLASCVRFALLIDNNIPGVSQLGASILALQWSVIEPGLGITAAALATLRPLIRRLNDGSFKPAAASSTQGPGGTSRRDTRRISKMDGGGGILVEVEMDQMDHESSTDVESQRHGKASQCVVTEATRPTQII